MLPRTSRFQSRPAVSAGHTSCWITERSGLPQKGTDRQVNDKTCEDKTIYSQRVVDTETYMGDGEWATGGGESARDECTPAARSAQIAQSTSCQHNKITGGAEKAPWTVTLFHWKKMTQSLRGALHNNGFKWSFRGIFTAFFCLKVGVEVCNFICRKECFSTCLLSCSDRSEHGFLSLVTEWKTRSGFIYCRVNTPQSLLLLCSISTTC